MPRGNGSAVNPLKWKLAEKMARERLGFPSRGKRGSEENRRRMQLAGRLQKLTLQIYLEELYGR